MIERDGLDQTMRGLLEKEEVPSDMQATVLQTSTIVALHQNTKEEQEEADFMF